MRGMKWVKDPEDGDGYDDDDSIDISDSVATIPVPSTVYINTDTRNYGEIIETESEEQDLIRRRIINVLCIYPRISPSMLQAGIGPSTKAGKWRPILEQMIKEGIVIRDQKMAKAPGGVHRVATILSLNPLVVEDVPLVVEKKMPPEDLYPDEDDDNEYY